MYGKKTQSCKQQTTKLLKWLVYKTMYAKQTKENNKLTLKFGKAWESHLRSHICTKQRRGIAIKGAKPKASNNETLTIDNKLKR
jgi:hypothetical protein